VSCESVKSITAANSGGQTLPHGRSTHRDARGVREDRRIGPRILVQDEEISGTPLDEAGGRWAVAAPSGVIILDEDGIDVRHAWDRINRGTWDARERTFTLELLDEAEPLVLVVPDLPLRGPGKTDRRAVAAFFESV